MAIVCDYLPAETPSLKEVDSMRTEREDVYFRPVRSLYCDGAKVRHTEKLLLGIEMVSLDGH